MWSCDGSRWETVTYIFYAQISNILLHLLDFIGLFIKMVFRFFFFILLLKVL